MAKRKRKQAKTEERIQPTHERLARGDVEIGGDNVYRSFASTILDHWHRNGFLGHGAEATSRFEALSDLMEMAQAASLSASNTSRFDRVGDRTSGDVEPDVGALDRCRHLVREVPLRYRSILMAICCSPDDMIMVDRLELQAAADHLIEVLERRQKNRTNHESVLDNALKL